ncbi:MAG: murein biosynthesis integral membrane protein MurJ [Pseudomonadota bacterium]
MSTGTEPGGERADGAGTARNVAAQGSVVAGMTLLSRISGFARDMVLSHFFGAGAAADAFFVAFRIPNFFRRMFAEGAFAQAFVPVLARYRSGDGGALREFVSTVFGNLAAAVWSVSLLGVLLAPVFVAVFAPGFWNDAAQFDRAAGMLRVTFPYLGFIALTAFAAALQNSYHRYAVPAFTPVLLNLTLIAAMLFAVGWFEEPVYALAWGVFAAGALQLAFQLPALGRLGLLVPPRLGVSHPGVRQVGKLMLPALFAASASQINTVVDTILASTLITGSISWLYYADRLLELPIGLVAVALGTVLLPNLSRLVSTGDERGFAATLDWGVRMGVLLGLPAAAALYVLALPLVAGLFYHGEMTALDARMAALALQAFAVGLLPLVLVKVVAPAYYAREDTATPFRFALVSVVTNVVLNLALFSWLGHVGLALATAAAGWVNAGLLLRGLAGPGAPPARRYRPGRAVYATAARAAFATAVMAAALGVMLPPPEAWLEAGVWQRTLWLAATVPAGGICYLLVLLASGERLATFLHRA